MTGNTRKIQLSVEGKRTVVAFAALMTFGSSAYALAVAITAGLAALVREVLTFLPNPQVTTWEPPVGTLIFTSAFMVGVGIFAHAMVEDYLPSWLQFGGEDEAAEVHA